MDVTLTVPILPDWLLAVLAYIATSYAGAWGYYKLPKAVRHQLFLLFGTVNAEKPNSSSDNADPLTAPTGSEKTSIALAPIVTAMLLRNLLVNVSNSSKQIIIAGFWLLAGYIGVKTVMNGADYLNRIIEAFQR